MPSPFPGMDPYIERPALWPDFHNSLIHYIREVLQPVLRPRYVVLGEDRTYIVEHQRSVRPDLAVVRTNLPAEQRSGTAVLEDVDEPIVVEVVEEEIRQPYLQIIEPAASGRLVTALEVLSPDNKRSGKGRDSYLAKRQEFRESGANVVEIDLLRDGDRLIPEEAELPPVTPHWHYLVTVFRQPNLYEYYARTLFERLPRFLIPLDRGDADIRLDLQAVFSKTWDFGPYPATLNYDQPLRGPITQEEEDWCRQQTRTASA
jgi:hypothetical protein